MKSRFNEQVGHHNTFLTQASFRFHLKYLLYSPFKNKRNNPPAIPFKLNFILDLPCSILGHPSLLHSFSYVPCIFLRHKQHPQPVINSPPSIGASLGSGAACAMLANRNTGNAGG